MSLGCPFLDTLGPRHEPGDPYVVAVDVVPEMCGPSGAVHGGLVASLIDCAGAAAVARSTNRPVATSNMTVSYLRAAKVGPLEGRATVLRVSKTLGVSSVEVYDVGNGDEVVAAALVTLRLLDGTVSEAYASLNQQPA